MNASLATIKAAPEEDTQRTDTLWGLDARELYEAFWASRGVQVVYRGRPTTLQRSAELFLLQEPDQLVMFNVGDLTERLAWQNAIITRLRIVDSDTVPYRERVQIDDRGYVERIQREYHSGDESSYRVLLTCRRRAASAWMHAANRRDGWLHIRRRVTWSRIDHCRCEGRCFDQRVDGDRSAFTDHVVATWTEPHRVIEGIAEHRPAVWMSAEANPAPDAVLIGPLWIGHGVEIDGRAVCVGPDWRADAAAGPQARVRRIAEVEEAESPLTEGWAPECTWAQSSAKRAIDLVFSGFALLLLIVPLAIVALFIYFDDGRPLVYSHKRQTRGGRTFRCWKFRTMVRNADQLKLELAERNQADGPQFFIENDPRVTRMGRLLRRFHIDELPQFWNVFRGQMSLVGPRPSPDSENQFCPAWRDARLSVRPGITGLWQLRRTREPGTDFQEWIRYDIEYVRNASLRLDVSICLLTLKGIIMGRSGRAHE